MNISRNTIRYDISRNTQTNILEYERHNLRAVTWQVLLTLEGPFPLEKKLLNNKLIAILVIILSSAVFVPGSVNAQTTALNLGIVSSLPATYFQNPGTGLAVGNTVTLFPYLQVNQMSIGGVLQPGICNVQTLASGSKGDKWIVNLISPDLKWSDGVPITSDDLAYSFGIFLTTGPFANTAKVDF